MTEIVGNLHLHTTASDGAGSHDEVAAAAARAGLDFISYSDHNIWVKGIEGWYHDPASQREVLRLMGQEVNDVRLKPECNHMLCHFVSQDLQSVADRPQTLIDTVNRQQGLSFLAHPLERPGLREAVQLYPWVRWDIEGFTGIELWNAMTDVKWQLRTMARGVLGAYLPQWVLTGPFPEVLAKWDALLAAGRKVVAIGGADAHGHAFSLGPLTQTIYPYQFLFRAVNTHLILADPLARDVETAKAQIREALRAGHCFVTYDHLASARGFSFVADSGQREAMMGDTLRLRGRAQLRVLSPEVADLYLLKDGRVIAHNRGQRLDWSTVEPGIYRVEAYRRYWGRRRGWVFTNPIYIEGAVKDSRQLD